MSALEWLRDAEGEWIPSWNQKLLASQVSASKEAQRWVQYHESLIGQVPTIIVFGLSGGHHVWELARRYPGSHVLVVERHLDFLRPLDVPLPNVQIFAGLSQNEILDQEAIQRALQNAFILIKYAASIQVDPSYYADIEQILLGRTHEALKLHLKWRKKDAQWAEDIGLTLLLENQKDPLSVIQVADQILRHQSQTQEPFDERSMTWLALRELVK